MNCSGASRQRKEKPITSIAEHHIMGLRFSTRQNWVWFTLSGIYYTFNSVICYVHSLHLKSWQCSFKNPDKVSTLDYRMQRKNIKDYFLTMYCVSWYSTM